LRKPHNEELHDLYSLTTIVRLIKSRRMRWTGNVGGRGEACSGFFVGNPDGRIKLGRTRSRWEDNIKMNLQEMGCVGMDWI
jgi:hypothetical protein